LQIQFFAHLTTVKVISVESLCTLLRSFVAVLDEFGVSIGRAKKAAQCAGEGLLMVSDFRLSAHASRRKPRHIGWTNTKRLLTNNCRWDNQCYSNVQRHDNTTEVARLSNLYKGNSEGQSYRGKTLLLLLPASLKIMVLLAPRCTFERIGCFERIKFWRDCELHSSTVPELSWTRFFNRCAIRSSFGLSASRSDRNGFYVHRFRRRCTNKERRVAWILCSSLRQWCEFFWNNL